MKDGPWRYYVTGTFRGDYTSLARARSCWGKYAGIVQQVAFEEPVWVAAFEEHPRRANNPVHVHSLVGRVGKLMARDMWQLWYELYGVNRVQLVVSEGVAGYVGKYLSKGGEVDFSRNFGRWVKPAEESEQCLLR